ncbi:hypothetical protein [Arthrobacter luteolus]|uniref:hypothetical protein n=1 Tax=Arthrobacter luteolus TaxID=98672 RepID=UPI0038513B43
MLKRISKFAVVIAAAFGLALTGLAPAGASEGQQTAAVAAVQQSPSLQQLATPGSPDAAEPQDVAGKYYTFCISLGVSHSWDGNPPESCPGWLDVYINGQHTAHLNMGATDAPVTWSCVIGVGLGMATLFAPGAGQVGWALAGTLAGIGVTIAGCAGF